MGRAQRPFPRIIHTPVAVGPPRSRMRSAANRMRSSANLLRRRSDSGTCPWRTRRSSRPSGRSSINWLAGFSRPQWRPAGPWRRHSAGGPQRRSRGRCCHPSDCGCWRLRPGLFRRWNRRRHGAWGGRGRGFGLEDRAAYGLWNNLRFAVRPHGRSQNGSPWRQGRFDGRRFAHADCRCGRPACFGGPNRRGLGLLFDARGGFRGRPDLPIAQSGFRRLRAPTLTR